VVGRESGDLLLRNFEGGVYRYPDPEGLLGVGRITAAAAE
jgi:lysine 2,3-aminomutase